jgi:hypothetical protein
MKERERERGENSGFQDKTDQLKKSGGEKTN